MTSEQKPLVSICSITYNHEKYIRQTLDGFLTQKTNFPFEIIIHDDASTDATADIIREYARRDSRIKPILREKNIKSKGKPIFPITFKKAKGKYIALCEGDDYWTDSLKLQKQVDFFEQYPDVNLVHTDFDWLDEKTDIIIKNYYKTIDNYFSQTYDIKQFLFNPKARTLTVCFRSTEAIGFGKLFEDNYWTVGDTALILYVLKDKKIGFINESTGVYRRGLNTASSKINPKKQFEYWQNASQKVKQFFYDYYHLNDLTLKQHLTNDYYNNMFRVAVPARKFKYIIKSSVHKLFHLQLTKTDLVFLLHSMFNIIKK